MQYKIPQNVQIEDRIVGPITFKQLFILGIGGGITYLIYLSLAKKYFIEVWILFVAPSALLTLAMAFVKPLGVSFFHYILLFIEYMILPKKRHWVKGADSVRPSVFTQFGSKPSRNEKKAINKREADEKKIENLAEISKVLDSK